MRMIFLGKRRDEKEMDSLFTSAEYEFVSAYQLIRNYKVPNSISDYEAIIRHAVSCGMREEEVRIQLEYMIMADFILSNMDRHFNNFGFLYDPVKHRLTAMAPIFDTGNSLFYNSEIIPSGQNLLEVAVSSFCKREVALSRDLLEGKRGNVLESAVAYYYNQACEIAEGMKIAREYRRRREDSKI